MISIIIPVYNTSKYLRRCIDSVLKQTFTDFELLLINDGSTDNSLEILREYEAKDRRIFVIDKPNEGVSAARNQGIKIAKGEYIMFCDSDDYVANNWCEQLYKLNLQHLDEYLCLVNLCYINHNGSLINRNPRMTDGDISLFECFKTGILGSPTNKIYSKRILDEHNIRFAKGIPIGEDVEFNCKYLNYCKGLKYIAVPTYFYCESETSALKKYYHDLMYYHLRCFEFRLPFISDEEMLEYCDFSFSYIFPMFHNVFDKRNHESWFKKMKFNQKMIKTGSFAFMVNHLSDQAIDTRSRRILKKQNYYLYYFISKLVHLKNRIIRRLSK